MERKCLNPCSTGITFLTAYNVLIKQIMEDGLNPCSTGITFLTLA